MPHIIIKMYEGRTEAQKKELVKKITEIFIDIAKVTERSISIAIEEFDMEEWTDKVYKPDIIEKRKTLYKIPGYNPFDKV